MARHGARQERTRKHRKRRGRNRQSWLDRGAVVKPPRARKPV